jgi:hypothetical protein
MTYQVVLHTRQHLHIMRFCIFSTDLTENGVNGGLGGHEFRSSLELVLGDLGLMLDVDLVIWASAVGGRTDQLESDWLRQGRALRSARERA